MGLLSQPIWTILAAIIINCNEINGIQSYSMDGWLPSSRQILPNFQPLPAASSVMQTADLYPPVKYPIRSGESDRFINDHHYNPLSILGSFSIRGRAQSKPDFTVTPPRMLSLNSEANDFLVPPPKKIINPLSEAFYQLNTTDFPLFINSPVKSYHKTIFQAPNYTKKPTAINSFQPSASFSPLHDKYLIEPKPSNQTTKQTFSSSVLVTDKNSKNDQSSRGHIRQLSLRPTDPKFAALQVSPKESSDKTSPDDISHNKKEDNLTPAESTTSKVKFTIKLDNYSPPTPLFDREFLNTSSLEGKKVIKTVQNSRTYNRNTTPRYVEVRQNISNKILPYFSQSIETPESISLKHFNEVQFELQKELLERDKLRLEMEEQRTYKPQTILKRERENGLKIDVNTDVKIHQEDGESDKTSNLSSKVTVSSKNKSNSLLSENQVRSNQTKTIKDSRNTSISFMMNNKSVEWDIGRENRIKDSSNYTRDKLQLKVTRKDQIIALNNDSFASNENNSIFSRVTTRIPSEKHDSKTKNIQFVSNSRVTSTIPSIIHQNQSQNQILKADLKSNESAVECKDLNFSSCIFDALKKSIKSELSNPTSPWFNSTLKNTTNDVVLKNQTLMDNRDKSVAKSSKVEIITRNVTGRNEVKNSTNRVRIRQTGVKINLRNVSLANMTSLNNNSVNMPMIDEFVPSIEQLFNVTVEPKYSVTLKSNSKVENSTKNDTKLLKNKNSEPWFHKLRPVRLRNITRPRFSIKEYKSRRNNNYLTPISDILNSTNSFKSGKPLIFNKSINGTRNHTKFQSLTVNDSIKIDWKNISTGESHSNSINSNGLVNKTNNVKDSNVNPVRNKYKMPSIRRKSPIHSALRLRLSALKKNNTQAKINPANNESNSIYSSKHRESHFKTQLRPDQSGKFKFNPPLKFSFHKNNTLIKKSDNFSLINQPSDSTELSLTSQPSVNNLENPLDLVQNHQGSNYHNDSVPAEDLKTDVDLFTQVFHNIANLTSSGSSISTQAPSTSKSIPVPSVSIDTAIKNNYEDSSLPIETFFKALKL